MDQTNQLSSVTYPNGQVTNYTYYPNSATTPGNDDRRLAQIQNLASANGTNISTLGYTYDAVGNILTWSHQESAGTYTSTFAYDAADQLIRAAVPFSDTHTVGYSYGYDKAGNRTREQIATTMSGGTFNNVNALTSLAPGGAMEFTGTLDKAGTVTLAGNAATVDNANNWHGTATVATGANSIALVAADGSGHTTNKTINVTVTGDAARTLVYDLNGNLTSNGDGQTYVWDAANRLTTVTYSDGSYSTFVYNGVGQRVEIKETDASGTVPSDKHFVWAGGAQPVEERDVANNVARRFYAQGEQIGGTPYFYTKNHLGSVREVTNSSAAVIGRNSYDLYGRLSESVTTVESTFGYTGMYRHQKSGLDLTLYRAYDPELGRWISRDPIAERGGLNLYGYVRNGPINYVDIYGQWPSSLNTLEGVAVMAALTPEASPVIEKGVQETEALATRAEEATQALECELSQIEAILANESAAAESGAGETVLGHYPEYTQLADQVGARRFQIPAEVWDKMTDAARWVANQKFLDRMIKRGDDVLLATPIDKVKPGSYFQRELEYLFDKGYQLSNDGMRLVFGED